jgi:S-methylmethionine-dependent homocysteine/selenocysteine methylase
MPKYRDLKERIDRGETIILDGAVGTQLQAMEVPNDPYCWAAIANHTHPYTVRKKHEEYIKSGVDIITTNTYSAARHNYEPAGLDFIIAEPTGEFQQRKWVFEAAVASGLPFWTGYECHLDERTRAILSSYESNMPLEDELERLLPIGSDVVSIFHSDMDDITRALPIVRSKWKGPICVYPEAGRRDYVYGLADPRETNKHSMEEWLAFARRWMAEGVQVIGGCCGIGVEYIRALQKIKDGSRDGA